MTQQHKLMKLFIVFAMFQIMIAITPAVQVRAEEVTTKTAVSIGTIDYDALTMQVNTNGNSIIYYSIDKKDWYEVEGNRTADNKAYLMDISWVPATEDKTIYLKGDSVTNLISVAIPARDTTFKASYSKADGDFTFDNCDEAVSFQWKKGSDYLWRTVSFDTSSTSYVKFMEEIEGLLVKGSKISLRLPQIVGKSEVEPGARPSKEVSVSLVKRANAPSVKVNAAKLTLNTTTSMEYYDDDLLSWVECDKNMLIEDIAPSTLFKNGAKNVTLMIRTAASSTKSYSKSAYLVITGQAAAPTIGGTSSDLSYWYQNGKLVLQFNNASKTNAFSYAIVKPGDTYNASTARFTTITNIKAKTISASTAPEGSMVYIRKQGINENASKNINLELSSETKSFLVTYK